MSDQVVHRWEPSERLVNLARRFVAKLDSGDSAPLSKWRSSSPLLNYLSDHAANTRIYNAVGRYMQDNGEVSVDRFRKELVLPGGGLLRSMRGIGPSSLYDLREMFNISVED